LRCTTLNSGPKHVARKASHTPENSDILKLSERMPRQGLTVHLNAAQPRQISPASSIKWRSK
jgi:hypothetical protein